MSTSIILIQRRDLLSDSLRSGLLMLAVGIGLYWLLFFFYPSYIHDFWFLRKNWYTTLLFGIPLGEYIWYFLVGAFIGPLYEYIEKGKLTNNK